MADVVEAIDAATAIALDGDGALKAQIARLEMETARLTAKLAEATAKLNELAFISERLRIENKGPPGAKGERGRDGRDGVGRIGPAGPVGPPGKAAPTITAWSVNSDEFSAVPILSDGALGATLRLRPLFESFNDQINADDDAREADAAASSRAATERQAELARQGLPAR